MIDLLIQCIIFAILRLLFVVQRLTAVLADYQERYNLPPTEPQVRHTITLCPRGKVVAMGDFVTLHQRTGPRLDEGGI